MTSDVAMARSAAYGFLAQAFRCPDSRQWSLLGDRERWSVWPEILNRQRPETGDALRLFQERLLSPDPARSVRIETAQAVFARLFGHTVKGVCPAYELEYENGEIFQRVAGLSDLQGFYTAFGLELQDQVRERVDHVSVECEFMSIMAAKEAYAQKENEEEGLVTVREAAGHFLEAHLGRWLPSLARRITEADNQGFYGALGDFAGRFIQDECRHYGAPIGPRMLELRSADETEETVQRCAVGEMGEGCPVRST